MKILLFSIILASISLDLTAQSPVINTYAYSRKTISGIKGEADRADSGRKQNVNPFPIRYFLFFSTSKGTGITISGVWLRGKYYTASLQKVNTPVLLGPNGVNIGMEQKDTLITATSDDVYAIQLGAAQSWEPQNDMEIKLTQNNQLVVFLQSNNTACYGFSNDIKSLHPYRAM